MYVKKKKNPILMFLFHDGVTDNSKFEINVYDDDAAWSWKEASEVNDHARGQHKGPL